MQRFVEYPKYIKNKRDIWDDCQSDNYPPELKGTG